MWNIILIIIIIEFINYLYFLRIKKIILNKEYYYGDRFDLSIRRDFLESKNQIKYIGEYIEFRKTENTNLSYIAINPLIKFFLSLYFNKTKKQARLKHMNIIYTDIQKFRNKYNISLTFNDDKKFKRFGQSDIQCCYKPLIISFIMTIIKLYSEIKLKMNGFTKYYSKQTNICYWSNKYQKNTSNNIPLFFLHGLGIGIIPYLDFIIDMAKDRLVICPVLPNISNVYFHPLKFNLKRNDFFPSFDIIYQEINQIIELHKFNKFDIVSHSFGTFIQSSLILESSFRSRLRKKIFIDPVCFHSNLTKVLKSVDQKKMDRGSNILGEITHYFVYLDVYVKYATKRNLFSMEFLWGNYRYLDENTLIILSGNDSITASDEIFEDIYKAGYGDKVEWLENANHGDLFMTSKWPHTIKRIKKYLS
ncbi:hypothetical protein CPAV1605_687 [seawater metagenome]|uniref:Alpha/beta hydrolase family n=1 Tax=seawater metagenome TaxID=1561972 RepID=A0A5E8CLT6_9ZZZZ